VYQAKDTRNNDIVALKVLPRSRARDKTFLQRFEQEARAAFELDHPNIVHGLDVDFADGYHFLVMEFVQGHDVYALLEEKGRLPENEALSILEQIASALDHINGERLVHRDIKPENILVTETGIAKLADMGLAVDNEAQGRRRITQAGIAMGTPFYLSPEQIEGRSDIDIRSDIYALGATVYEMVTGRPPFDGETPAVVMMKHLNEQVPSPHDVDRTISLQFCHLLEKMMAKNPALRYQTPAELLIDLQRVKKNENPLGVRPPAGKSSISQPKQYKEPGQQELEAPQPVDAGDGKQDPAAEATGSDSRYGQAARARRPQLSHPTLASARSRSQSSAATEADPGMKYAFLVALTIIVAVLAFLLIAVLGQD
jgi:serine/threonine-protein kinase